MRTPQRIVNGLMGQLSAALGGYSIAECWEHLASVTRYVEKRNRMQESALIIGPYRFGVFTAYWVSSVSPGTIAQHSVTLPIEALADSPLTIAKLISA